MSFTFILDGWQPDWTVHPGMTLHELLEESGMSQADPSACHWALAEARLLRHHREVCHRHGHGPPVGAGDARFSPILGQHAGTPRRFPSPEPPRSFLQRKHAMTLLFKEGEAA